jgi:hypothetical protein
LSPSKSASNLICISEIARIQSGGKPPGRENRLVDIYHEKPIRLSVRVLVPVKEHPKVTAYISRWTDVVVVGPPPPQRTTAERNCRRKNAP